MSSYLQRIDEKLMDWFEPRLWLFEHKTGAQRRQLAWYLLCAWVVALNIPLLAKGAQDGPAFYLVAIALGGIPVGVVAMVGRRVVQRHNFGGAGKQNMLRGSWKFRAQTLFVYFLLSPFLADVGGLPSPSHATVFIGTTTALLGLFLAVLCANLMPPGFRKELEVEQMEKVGRRVPT